MKSPLNVTMDRREFLGSAGAAGALVLGFALPRRLRAAMSAPAGGTINAFLSIAPNGKVTVQSPFVEMGEGTYTSIPMLLAEELDVEMSAIRVEQAPPEAAYRLQEGGKERYTGGSDSVRSSWEPLRKAGATARAMLIAAAEKQSGIPARELSTEPGAVVHKGSGRRFSYGDLAATAGAMPVPETVKLKDPAEFRLLGTPVPRLDAEEKSNGQAKFGIDFQMKGALTAVVRQSPQFSGEPTAIDSAEAQGMPGVVSVDKIPNGIAVIADHFWHAKKALDAVKVTFDKAPSPDFSTDGYLKKLRSRLDDAGEPAEDKGKAKQALRSAAKTTTADYSVPYLAHATMEPMNCAALVQGGKCTVWAPNQTVDSVVEAATTVTGLPKDAIEVHTPYLGGGFGRRFIMDYVTQAVTLAAKHPGKPIKVEWTREEDMQHDFYRPMTAARYRGGIDNKGNPVAVHITTVGDGPLRRFFSDPKHPMKIDDSVVEGSIKQPYSIPNWRCDYVFEYSPAPIGFWRSVGNSQNAFFKESFMDELAHLAERDPVEFRRTLLGKEPRFGKVLDTVAEMAGWRGKPWNAGDGRKHAMGVALHRSFGSIVGEVAEVSLDESGLPQVHRVWAAVDCGFAVNPLILTMQIESAIAYGLSAALHEQVTMKDGHTVKNNFDDYPVLTAQEMPDVQVKIVNSGADLGGIGEVGTPPIAPAVCNALFTLTGKRIRSLPLDQHQFT